jgi:peptidyl-dipeptidase Dcp
MKQPIVRALALAILLALGGCATTAPVAGKQESSMPATAYTGPFAAPSPLDLNYPQFDRIHDSDFAPAFDAGMAQQLREIEAIANNPEPPTFKNTIVAMEQTGRLLDRATTVLFNLVGTDKNDVRDQLQTEYAPRLSAHRDAINLNPGLFARIRTLHDARDTQGLDAADLRLLEKYYRDFVRAGAALNEAQKTRIREINTALSKLGTRFNQNVLAEVNDSAVVVERREELAGLGEEQIAATAEDAKARGLEGKYVIALLNTTGQPAEAQLQNRALRERLHRASVVRGSRGNQWDNTAIFSRVLKLRAERASLLGYDTTANFVLAEETAGNQDKVNAMLGALVPKALANARREGAELQAMIDQEQKTQGQASFELQPWDWACYSEKLRAAKYSFDEAQLKPYFEMKNVLENGVFYAAGKLYGISFKERTDLPKYHPDTWTYEVFDKDGSRLALFIFDPYARPSKRGGAWMNAYVSQSALTGEKPVVANHLNVPKPSAGKPTLLTWTEVTTAFHEFGHALHGFFQDVRYPYFSMRVPRDFVEYPSQVNEMWAAWPEVLAHYAQHYQTGAAMPQALLDKVIAASKFNQGFATTEYLEAAVLDQGWHQLGLADIPGPDQVMSTEAAILGTHGFDYAPVPPRYRTPYFSHIMGGYAAGYYAYIWSEVLGANTTQWMRQHGGLKLENGERLRERVLAPGGQIDPAQLFPNFAGYEAKIEPLLEQRGLSTD